MAFDTYADLQQEIIDYLARDDLADKIPSFITLTEAKLNRELYVRQMEVRSTTVTSLTDAQYVSLPTDFQSMRRIRLTGVDGAPGLSYLSNIAMDEYRTTRGDATGQPLYYTIFGDEIELAPTPDTSYTLEMVYRSVIPALAAFSSNWLLTLAPDVYLYGAMLESSPYLKNDPRIQVWALGFTTALDSLNRLGTNSTFNAGPLQMRISGVTP